MNLDIRLKRMEDAQAGSRLHGERRVIRIIAGENDTRAAYALAKERGFDAEDETSNDLIILRVVKTAPGSAPYSEAPRVV